MLVEQENEINYNQLLTKKKLIYNSYKVYFFKKIHY